MAHRVRAISMLAVRVLFVCAIEALVGIGAIAQVVPPDYGFTFATIGSPGNAAILAPISGCEFCPPRLVGGVNYEYRMATTEVSSAQWFDFIQAYAPFVPNNAAGSPSLIGFSGGVGFGGFNQQGVPTYFLPQGGANKPVDPHWRYALRFINWTHNGQKPPGQTTAADFENGVYDMAAIGLNGPVIRSPDARYWLPNLDEWVKAAYFDPNKNGPGQPGYWQYPITSDTAPVSGEPGQGGQTNAGMFPNGQTPSYTIGQYANIRSPWGLLDMSGGFSEWLENRGSLGERYRAGSSIAGLNPALADRLVWYLISSSSVPVTGFRIASAVPAPSAALIGLMALYSVARRRR